MQPHPLAAVVGDSDRQYLANIRHLRHKIAQVQHDQREIEGRPGFIRNPRKSLLTDGFDLEIFGVNYFNWWRQPGLWLNSGGSNNVPHTTLNN